MYSPIHPDVALVRTELEPGLHAFACPKSGGHRIPLQEYFLWRERHVQRTRPLPPDYQPELAEDSAQRTLICPESGALLLRYRVGSGLHFQIDRSPKTGGVWLDAGEWNALKSRGLHDELHLIFTAPYQRQLRSELSTSQLNAQFENRIGREDFERAKEIKSWLTNHPKRRDLLAFLLDDDS